MDRRKKSAEYFYFKIVSNMKKIMQLGTEFHFFEIVRWY